jgi:hypothetical protein
VRRALFATTALALAASGCVEPPPPPVLIAPGPATVATDDPNCRDYTALATIAGEQQQIVGRACRQPDGSWRIVEGTPEQPGQVILVYPPPPPAYGYPYPYPYYPWFWGPPFAVGASFVFFSGHGHHFGGHHHGRGHAHSCAAHGGHR